MKNVLKKARFYLSGAIEKTSDDGVDWRKKFADMCKEKNLPINIMDPTDKQDTVICEIGEARKRLQKLKSTHQFDEFTREMKRVRRWDLRACDYSHAVIVYIDPDIPTWGTIDECVTAERACHPVLAIVKGGAEKAPDWSFTIINHDEMFKTMEDMIEYLVDVNNGDKALDERWVFIKNG